MALANEIRHFKARAHGDSENAAPVEAEWNKTAAIIVVVFFFFILLFSAFRHRPEVGWKVGGVEGALVGRVWG